MSLRFLVSGMVQGVGFRWFVQRRATSLGLGGYVRNLPDGRVEVVVAGPDEALGALEDALRQGPSLASVTNVEKSSISDEIDSLKSFDIR